RVRQAVHRGSAGRSGSPEAPPRGRPQYPRRGRRPSETIAIRPGHQGPRETRRVLHERPRTGTGTGAILGAVEETEAEGGREAAAERDELDRLDRQDEGVVRPHSPRTANRFHAAGHTPIAGYERGATDSGGVVRASRPVAPRQRPDQDRPTQEARNRED